MKIGIFDSGLGGITVFQEILKTVQAEFYYLADNKHAPYGIKEKEEIKQYIFSCVEKLIELGCQIIVIACNTATSVAIETLRKEYPNIFFVGTEPAVKVAVDSGSKKDILVCSTSITAKEEKLNHLIASLNANKKVHIIALDKLVKFAESENCNLLEVEKYLKEKIEPYSNIGYVVLGCTHFPLFKEQFLHIVPSDVKLIDGSKGIAKRLKNYMEENNLSNISAEQKIILCMTKSDSIFENNFIRILGVHPAKKLLL